MTWLTIRNFGRVKYFNISYFVIIGIPLIAEAYKALNPTATKFDLPYTFPGSFKILYAASLCYAVAIAIYQYFCPAIIKHYENEEDYISASQEIYERAHPDRKIEIVLTNLIESQDDLKAEISKLTKDLESPTLKERKEKTERLGLLIEYVYPSCIQRFLVNEYQDAREKYQLAIYMSGILYIIGTLILLYLLAIRTIKVFSV